MVSPLYMRLDIWTLYLSYELEFPEELTVVLELPEELAVVQPVFYICMLKKCVGDPAFIA